MTDAEKDMEVVYGSGNPFRDFNVPNPDVEQAKALLAAEIIKIMRTRNLNNKDAEKITGVSHSEFSRIRKPDLKRFTVDRLMIILHKLDPKININVEIQSRRKVKRKPSVQAEISP